MLIPAALFHPLVLLSTIKRSSHCIHSPSCHSLRSQLLRKIHSGLLEVFCFPEQCTVTGCILLRGVVLFFLKRGSKRGKCAAGNISTDRAVMITEIVPNPDFNDPSRLLWCPLPRTSSPTSSSPSTFPQYKDRLAYRLVQQA